MEPQAVSNSLNISPKIVSDGPTYNERGVIAENYYDLQGLGVLSAARQAYALPKGSPESTHEQYSNVWILLS